MFSEGRKNKSVQGCSSVFEFVASVQITLGKYMYLNRWMKRQLPGGLHGALLLYVVRTNLLINPQYHPEIVLIFDFQGPSGVSRPSRCMPLYAVHHFEERANSLSVHFASPRARPL